MKKLLTTIMLFLGAFGGSVWGAEPHGGGPDGFSKADRKRIQAIIGYGLSADSIRRIFRHSSAGNTEFEALETLGDSYVQGCVAQLTPYRPGTTKEELHKSLKDKTTNEFLAEKFQVSGLARFAKVAGTPDMKTVYANMFEVLFAVIAENYFTKYPHLSAKGRGWGILVPIFRKLTEERTSEPVFLGAGIGAGRISAFPTVTTAKTPKASKASKKSSKIKMEVTIQKDGRTYTQTAKGKTESEARQNALNAVWPKLGISSTGSKSSKKKIKEFDAFERNRATYGIASITAERVL
jgi:hypothetical protein